MRVVIQSMPEPALLKLTNHETSKDLQATADTLAGEFNKIADHEPFIVKTLTWTQEKSKTTGTMTKFIVMLPCYAITALVILLNVFAVILTWFAITFFLYSTSPQTGKDNQMAQTISQNAPVIQNVVADLHNPALAQANSPNR